MKTSHGKGLVETVLLGAPVRHRAWRVEGSVWFVPTQTTLDLEESLGMIVLR